MRSLTIILIIGLIFVILQTLIYCAMTSIKKPEILTDFSEKITALVTTTVRSNLKDKMVKQNILINHLPRLERLKTFNQLIEELKEIEALKDIAYLTETDIMFELQKPENINKKDQFNLQEIQQEVFSSTILGIKIGLSQLRQSKDGK